MDNNLTVSDRMHSRPDSSTRSLSADMLATKTSAPCGGQPYTRPLSPFERMWLAAQTTCGMTLVEGHGRLSASDLRNAVHIASSANPGSRLKLAGYGPAARWMESDIFPTITEVDAGDWDGCGPEGAPFSDVVHMDPGNGPSASYVLVQGPLPRLIQRTHHATMDGLGAMQFLEDVFRAMRGEAVIGAHGAETDLDLARSLQGRSRRTANLALNPFGKSSNGQSGSSWCRIRVPCRGARQPLARTLMALAAAARRHGVGDVLIDIPVNLRNSFPALRNTGNLTGSLRLSIAPQASVESIQEDIRSQLAANRQADAIVASAGCRYLPIAVMRYAARTMARRAVARNEFSPSAAVSNLGRVPLDKFSTADFQARSTIVIPPGYDGVPLFLVMSGNDDGLDLCARAPLALGSDGRLKKLLEEIASAFTQ
ncbi:hypothetical protein BH11PSE11_BH11PSE11_07460 [soil metagenome]